jgi:hypothetical protein
MRMVSTREGGRQEQGTGKGKGHVGLASVQGRPAGIRFGSIFQGSFCDFLFAVVNVCGDE